MLLTHIFWTSLYLPLIGVQQCLDTPREEAENGTTASEASHFLVFSRHVLFLWVVGSWVAFVSICVILIIHA